MAGEFPDASHQRWILLTAEFPEDSRLKPSAIFALPTQLIDLLEKRLPELLTADDLRFERRLRERGGTGFRFQRAFGSEVLDPPDLGEVSLDLYGEFFPQMKRQSQFAMHGILASESEVTRTNLKHSRDTLQARFTQRLQGLAGWLVINSDFHTDVAVLREEWTQWPSLAVTLPDLELLSQTFGIGLNGSQIKAMSRLVQKATDFLRKWNLVRMDTWDLPVPISAVQFTDDSLPKNELQSMRVSVFIPWSLLAERDLKIREVVSYHRDHQKLPHLDGWIRKKGRADLGIARHAKILMMYVYLELAIKQRYGNRLDGYVRKLDEVFSAFWGAADEDAIIVGAESERKNREVMQRRLSAIGGIPTEGVPNPGTRP